jgi:uncharacterized membrane protein
MSIFKRINNDLFWICVLAVLSLLIQFFAYTPLGFHRDEFLYLALGKHLDTGYWSNPPLIGLISAASQLLPGNSLFTTRFFPALAGACLVILTGLIAKELGGRRFAQVFACVGLILSTLFLRAFSMLQPVSFDILFWTLSLYYLLKYIKTKKPVYIILLGLVVGIGILNKYNEIFLVAGILVAILLTRQRVLYKKSYFWMAVLIAILLILPNLLWQIHYHFPVAGHMSELVRTQLVHVDRMGIIKDQFFIFFACSLLWIPGLLWLLFSPRTKEFRVFGFIYIIVLAIFVTLRGKSYYAAGLYPFFFAAGAVFWDKLNISNYFKYIPLCIVVYFNLLFVPTGIPIYKTEGMVDYFNRMAKRTGSDMGTRWEDGRTHSLPQDYADMLGWDELANLVIKACDTVADKKQIMIYGENYGQAGSIDHFTYKLGYEHTIGFSDSFLFWAPDSITNQKKIFIYVNDQMGQDVRKLFAQIDSVGSITNKYAREYGTTVYMCRNARHDFPKFWEERVKQVKGERFSR